MSKYDTDNLKLSIDSYTRTQTMRISKSMETMGTRLVVKMLKNNKNMQDSIESLNAIKRLVVFCLFINIVFVFVILYTHLNYFMLPLDISFCQGLRDTEPFHDHVNFIEL